MFERYTENARRVIFFARYQASELGSPVIDTDHLLLGLLREEKLLCFRWIPNAQPEAIRQAVEGWSERHAKIPTTVDMPLSQASKRVLEHARDEALRLDSKHIGTEHLLLGLLQEKCKASDLLRDLGADVGNLRVRFAGDREREGAVLATESSLMNRVRAEIERRVRFGESIEIHGQKWNRDYILDGVKRCQKHNWHWTKARWKPRDVVVNRKTGKLSFDLKLAEDQENFELRKDGWKKDHCAICAWELFESDDHHGIGYTNGQQWVCLQCYDKFWDRPDFLSGAYSALT
jgi:hypothetical protein